MPTDYSNSKIYKIVCEDGKFYVGSTVLPLTTRFGQHRRAVENGINSKVYRHIRLIGGPEKARIQLVADNLGISTRDELLKIEDSYIREGLKSKLCLNRNKPRATSEERRDREILQKRMWRNIHRSRVDPDVSIADKVRQYYREHKRLPRVRKTKGDPEEIIHCECGWDLMRGQMTGHKKTKEHARELTRWMMMRKVLQREGIVAPDRPSLWAS